MTEPYSPAEDHRPEAFPQGSVSRSGRVRDVVAMLIAFSGGLAVMFLFFAAIGAVDLGEATGFVIVAVVFALIWLIGVLIRRRSGETTERITRADRERRGF